MCWASVPSPIFAPAVEAACRAGRKVNLQKVRPGSDRTVASVWTDEGGGYRVAGAKGSQGTFRALVTIRAVSVGTAPLGRHSTSTLDPSMNAKRNALALIFSFSSS